MTPDQVYRELREARTAADVLRVAEDWMDRCNSSERDGFRYELIVRLSTALARTLKANKP